VRDVVAPDRHAFHPRAGCPGWVLHRRHRARLQLVGIKGGGSPRSRATSKCSTSRYHNRVDGRPAAATAIVAIDITVHTPPADRAHRLRRSPNSRTPQPPTRRDRVTALLTSHPRRAWTGAELAENLQVKKRNMLTQLAEWTRLGFITRTSAGTYELHSRMAAPWAGRFSKPSGRPGARQRHPAAAQRGGSSLRFSSSARAARRP
jgi:hypothetical protein